MKGGEEKGRVYEGRRAECMCEGRRAECVRGGEKGRVLV